MSVVWVVPVLLITLVQVHCFIAFKSDARFARRKGHEATLASGHLKSALSAGNGNFLDRNFNINDDDDKNYDDDDETVDGDTEESIEELVKRVEGRRRLRRGRRKRMLLRRKKRF